MADEYPSVVAAVGDARYATAYKILDKWPESLWTGLGKDFALLSGFLDYKAEYYGDAVDELKPLADDAAYVARRPELLYYLGRAHYASASYTKAVDALERYVRSQRDPRPPAAARPVRGSLIALSRPPGGLDWPAGSPRTPAAIAALERSLLVVSGLATTP